jgi:hypothetical protein
MAMVSRIGHWRNGDNRLRDNAERDASRAAGEYERILDNPTDLLLIREKTAPLASQLVRVEHAITQPMEKSGAGGSAADRDGTIFGTRNHPVNGTLDIQRGDRFALNGQQYRVIDVVYYPGEIQAAFERQSR